jgi:hypothetical protein
MGWLVIGGSSNSVVPELGEQGGNPGLGDELGLVNLDLASVPMVQLRFRAM